jgi:hypothetical protein
MVTSLAPPFVEAGDGVTAGTDSLGGGAEEPDEPDEPDELAAMAHSVPEHLHSVPSATLIHVALVSMLQMPNLSLPLHTSAPGLHCRGQRSPDSTGKAAEVAQRPKRMAKIVAFIFVCVEVKVGC